MDLLEPAGLSKITAVWFLRLTGKLRLKWSASGVVLRIDLGSGSGFFGVQGLRTLGQARASPFQGLARDG